jgi:hypothetical protein
MIVYRFVRRGHSRCAIAAYDTHSAAFMRFISANTAKTPHRWQYSFGRDSPAIDAV